MLEEKARTSVEEHRMFGPGDLVVVGVSGGPDSVALLHWLWSNARELKIRLHVAHLNHMLRGKESEADARWVAALSRDWGLPFTVESRDVNAYRRELHLSVEDAARQVRYEFFARVMKETGANSVAVGHTADDQIETVVMHFLRGTGLAGLRGMLHVSVYEVPGFAEKGLASIVVVRPLLDASRKEVDEYVRLHGLEIRADRSNLELVYLRNRIRHQLIPQLLDYNPKFRKAVLRASETAAVDYDFIQTEVARYWSKLADANEERVNFQLKELLSLHPSIQRYLLRRAADWLVGSLLGLEAVHVADAMDLIRKGRTGAIITWPQGLRVVRTYDKVTIRFERQAEPSLPAEGQSLKIPGTTDIAGTDWRVVARIGDRPCEDWGPWHADVDYVKVGPRVIVRRRRGGDRFQPLGMKQEKSLQDFFVDQKVPRYQRDSVPIVQANDKEIVWVAGLRIDDRVKITPETKKVLCLRFEERS